jgi:hypothetical protein
MEKVAESQNLVDVAIKQQARLSGVLLGQSEKANETANNPHWLALDIRLVRRRRVSGLRAGRQSTAPAASPTLAAIRRASSRVSTSSEKRLRVYAAAHQAV